MAYVEESFTDKDERNRRWQELKRIHSGVIRYSAPVKQMDGTWVNLWFAAYPPAPVVPVRSHE